MTLLADRIIVIFGLSDASWLLKLENIQTKMIHEKL